MYTSSGSKFRGRNVEWLKSYKVSSWVSFVFLSCEAWDLVPFQISGFMDPLQIQVCQLIKLLTCQVRPKPRKSPFTLSSIWRQVEMIVFILARLSYLHRRRVLGSQCRFYHSVGVEDILSTMLNHSLGIYFSRVTGINSCCTSRCFSLTAQPVFMRLPFFFCLDKTLISIPSFRTARVTLCLARCNSPFFSLFSALAFEQRPIPRDRLIPHHQGSKCFFPRAGFL